MAEPVEPASLGLATVGSGVQVFPLARLTQPELIEIGDEVIIDDYVFLQGRGGMKIGDHVHIVSFASVSGGGPTRIGSFSTVAAGARLLSGSDLPDGEGLVNSTIPDRLRAVRRPGCRLGDFSYIGANSVIHPGVEVGTGAVVGSHSLVLENLEPWTIYAGSPARPLRERPRGEVLRRARSLGYLG